MSDAAPTDADERVKKESFFSKLMKKPELGAIAGVILVTLFFLATADEAMFSLSGIMNFMTPAAQLGILAIGAAMLMIGGEFDLSIGSMIGYGLGGWGAAKLRELLRHAGELGQVECHGASVRATSPPDTWVPAVWSRHRVCARRIPGL